MIRLLALVRFVIMMSFLLLNQIAWATQYYDADVTRLLGSDQPPEGVIFELAGRDVDAWKWAAPMIMDLRKQLLSRFPGIDIAIVSHGKEQFMLSKENQQLQSEPANLLKELTQDGVNLHVCGTHSSWRNVPEDAYIDIVDVAPSGPAQINDYIKLGYTHIILQKPENKGL